IGNGDHVIITLSEQDGNRDPGTVEQVTVDAITQNDQVGTSTSFDLKETGADTGVFTKDIEVGTDLKIADLSTNKFAESVKFTYDDLVASDGSSQTRELT